MLERLRTQRRSERQEIQDVAGKIHQDIKTMMKDAKIIKTSFLKQFLLIDNVIDIDDFGNKVNVISNGNSWITSKPVDMDETEPRKVIIAAIPYYCQDKTPEQTDTTAIIIQGHNEWAIFFSEGGMEIRSINPKKRNITYHITSWANKISRETTVKDAKFYQEVLNRFKRS